MTLTDRPYRPRRSGPLPTAPQDHDTRPVLRRIDRSGSGPLAEMPLVPSAVRFSLVPPTESQLQHWGITPVPAPIPSVEMDLRTAFARAQHDRLGFEATCPMHNARLGIRPMQLRHSAHFAYVAIPDIRFWQQGLVDIVYTALMRREPDLATAAWLVRFGAPWEGHIHAPTKPLKEGK